MVEHLALISLVAERRGEHGVLQVGADHELGLGVVLGLGDEPVVLLQRVQLGGHEVLPHVLREVLAEDLVEPVHDLLQRHELRVPVQPGAGTGDGVELAGLPGGKIDGGGRATKAVALLSRE